MKSQVFLAAAVAALACVPALAAPPAPGADAWARMPALPTACYSAQDPWVDQNTAALEAVRQNLARQKEVNKAIDEKLDGSKNENPMAMAQAMQQAMMNDPQNAQKYMQGVAQKGQQFNAESPALIEKEQKLEAESKTLIQQYHSALDKAYEPAGERFEALRKKLGPGAEWTGMPDPSWPQWAWKEWAEIRRLQDRLYIANCATWWSATGPIHSYFKRYKDFLVQERMPFMKKVVDEAKLENYKMLSVPTTGWRTTTDYEAAEDYMFRADTLFRERYQGPLCPASAENCL